MTVMRVSIEPVGDWHYYFTKISDMSFKGPRILREQIAEIRRNFGEVERINYDSFNPLADFLSARIQPEINEESSEPILKDGRSLREYYQHNLDDVLFKLRGRDHNDFQPEHLLDYLRLVHRREKDCHYLPASLLNLMAVVCYNLEIKRRCQLYLGPGPGREGKIRIFHRAKRLIKAKGLADHVLELSQPTPVGGITYTVSPTAELDKKYIGYRGFLTYEDVCKRLKRMQNDERRRKKKGN